MLRPRTLRQTGRTRRPQDDHWNMGSGMLRLKRPRGEGQARAGGQGYIGLDDVVAILQTNEAARRTASCWSVAAAEA